MVHGLLFALAFRFVPELAAWRRWYECFWLSVALLGIGGWLLVFILVRRAVPAQIKWSARFVIAALGAAGGALGWALWQSGWLWYWGTDAREIAEIGSCVLTGAAWGVVCGQLVFKRRATVMGKPDPSDLALPGRSGLT